MDECFHLDGRPAERGGDLPVRQVVKEPQLEYRAVVDRHPGQRHLQVRVTAGDGFVGPRAPPHVPGDCKRDLLGPPPSPSELVDADVPRDLAEPRLERAGPHAPQRSVRAHERLLDGVFRIARIAEHVEALERDVPPVTAEERLERVVVAARGRGHEHPVGRRAGQRVLSHRPTVTGLETGALATCHAPMAAGIRFVPRVNPMTCGVAGV